MTKSYFRAIDKINLAGQDSIKYFRVFDGVQFVCRFYLELGVDLLPEPPGV